MSSVILYSTNTGTIPDEVSVSVNLLPISRHIGSVEEEFLEKMRKGDILNLIAFYIIRCSIRSITAS